MVLTADLQWFSVHLLTRGAQPLLSAEMRDVMIGQQVGSRRWRKTMVEWVVQAQDGWNETGDAAMY